MKAFFFRRKASSHLLVFENEKPSVFLEYPFVIGKVDMRFFLILSKNSWPLAKISLARCQHCFRWVQTISFWYLFLFEKTIFVKIRRWREVMAIWPNLLRKGVRIWFHVSRKHFMEHLFSDKYIHIHHFWLLSWKFFASSLKFFRWVCQNCILHVKNNNLRDKLSFKQKLFSSFLNFEDNFLAFCRKNFRSVREIEFHVSRQGFWRISFWWTTEGREITKSCRKLTVAGKILARRLCWHFWKLLGAINYA